MHANYDHEQLIDYIEGELPPEQMARVDALLASDQKLRRLIESIKADRKALRAMPPDEAPRALVDDVMAGLERQQLLGEAPLTGDDVDEIAAEAQRNRMTIGPRLLRIASYTGLAAALAIAGGVVFLTVTDSPLLEQANPQRWDTFGNDPLALRDGMRSRTTDAERALSLDDLDAIGKSGEAVSKLDGSSLALKTPTPPRAAVGEGGLALGKAAHDDAAGPGPLPAKGGIGGGIDPLLSAAQITGNRGQFALRLPQPDESNAVIEVVSDDVDDTTAGLNRWLAFNGAQIVPAELAFGQTEASLGTLKESARQRSESAGYAADALTRQSAYAVVIDDDQVPELLNYMNNSRAGRQVARLVEPEQPQRVALRQADGEGWRNRYQDAEVRPRFDTEAAELADAAPQAGAPTDTDELKEEAQQEAVSAREPRIALKGGALPAPAESEKAERHEAADQREAMEAVSPADEPLAQAGAKDEAAASIDELRAEGVTRTQASKLAASAEEGDQVGEDEMARDDLTDGQRPAPAPREGSPAPLAEADSTQRVAPSPSAASEPGAPGQVASRHDKPLRDADVDTQAAGRGFDEAADIALFEQVNTFDWGAVLGNQLPLAESTPLAFARRGRVVLPLVITESTRGDRDGWRDMSEDAAGAANQSREVPAEPAEPVDPAR